MIRKIYEVRTEKYKTYYTEAADFEEAKIKTELYILDQIGNSVIDANGDLIRPEEDRIKCVTCLTEDLIR